MNVTWYKVPERLEVKVYPSEVEGEEGLYIASIGGQGQDLNLYTQGTSPVGALRAALSALCGVTNTCSANATGDHCFCSLASSDSGATGRRCCHCKTWRNGKMFEAGPVS